MQARKIKLSGSTDGRGIKVAATATAGTTIHTSQTGTTVGKFDEIWLWCVNSSGGALKLTIEFGGTTAPDDTIEYTIPAEDGLHLVLPGLLLQNAAVVRAFATTTNLLIVHGFVNQITTP